MRERNIDWLPTSPHAPYWGSNRQPFGAQEDAQPTEPHCPTLSYSVSRAKSLKRSMLCTHIPSQPGLATVPVPTSAVWLGANILVTKAPA